SWHALSYTPSRAQALELKARVEKLPAVSRAVEIASLVPSDQAAKLPMPRDIHARLARLPPPGKPPDVLAASPSLLVAELRLLAPARLRQGIVVGISTAGRLRGLGADGRCGGDRQAVHDAGGLARHEAWLPVGGGLFAPGDCAGPVPRLPFAAAGPAGARAA